MASLAPAMHAHANTGTSLSSVFQHLNVLITRQTKFEWNAWNHASLHTKAVSKYLDYHSFPTRAHDDGAAGNTRLVGETLKGTLPLRASCMLCRMSSEHVPGELFAVSGFR